MTMRHQNRKQERNNKKEEAEMKKDNEQHGTHLGIIKKQHNKNAHQRIGLGREE